MIQTFAACLVYAIAMTLANFSVAVFGPASTPFNAFLFIGLDLALRDWLHVKISRLQLAGLIVFTSILTFVLNPAVGTIALASAVAFASAAVADWFVFSRVKGSWAKRANTSNVAGSAVDSLVFPTIAFGSVMPEIMLMQFLAKILGAGVWVYLITKSKVLFKDLSLKSS